MTTNSTTHEPLTPDAVRHLFEAQKRRLDLAVDRIDALEDENQALRTEIAQLFTAKDGRSYSTSELIFALDHRLKMKDGEIDAVWRKIWDVKSQLQTIQALITKIPSWAARWPSPSRKRNELDGRSPYDATNKQ